jgi:hypothetical protein
MGPFYASIKFKTGEEILCYVKNANPEIDTLVIDNPVEVEEIDIPGVVQGMKLKAWMKVSHESEFTISGEDLVTIKEMNTQVINFYKASLKKLDYVNNKKPSRSRRRSKGRIPLDSDMGLLSSIEDARELLEEVFLMDIKDKEES